MRLFRWMMGLALFFFALPSISVVIAGVTAHLLGCTLNEGNVNPCHFLGISLGPLLTGMGVAGWLMLVSLPLGALVLLTWIVVELVQLVRKKSRAKMSATPSGSLNTERRELGPTG
jgi:hypothetical protein